MTRCKVDPSNTKPIRGAIWLLDVQAGNPPRKLADVNGFADALEWSPDGKRIAFLYVAGATRLPEATASGNPRVGVIGGEDKQIEQIASISSDGGPPQALTPQGLYVYEFRWAPSGQRIAYTAAPPPGDDNWWTAKLYTQDAQAGAAPKMILDPATVNGPLHGLQIALPRWSPSAARIFFIGGLMSDRGSTGGDIYSVPASGGAPVDMTTSVQVSPAWFVFMDERTLLVSQIASGHVQLAEYTIDENSARQTRLWFTVPGNLGDGRAVHAVSLSRGPRPRIAYFCSSFAQPPEVHSGLLTTAPPPAVTSINADLINGKLNRDWGKAQSVEWNNQGFHVQG